MTNRHPYVQAPKHLPECITRFRKALPTVVTAATFQKLGIASKNERYLISTLRFLSLIDEEGKPTDDAKRLFSQNHNDDFQSQFSEIVKKPYSELFELHGDSAWKLGRSELITYFRNTDQTSDAVGTRQATTFMALSGLCGYSDPPVTRSVSEKPTKRRSARPTTDGRQDPVANGSGVEVKTHDPTSDALGRHFGLTVRVEINLPASGDRETYDNIFRSIRDNLINA